MEKRDIINYINEYVKANNKDYGSDIKYFTFEGKSQKYMKKEFDFDLRLNQEEYLKNSITIIGETRIKKEKVVNSTIFIVDKDIYKDKYFWVLDKMERSLKKKSLFDYSDIIGDLCIIIGYTHISYKIRKANRVEEIVELNNFFSELANSIVHNNDMFSLIEPNGVFRLNRDQVQSNKLTINDNKIISSIGKIYEENLVAHKMSTILKMFQMKNLFSLETLGPVFFSKI